MPEVYERNSFFVAYMKWHYGKGFRELFGVTGNFLWFIRQFFSFKLLVSTLFSPWKRLGERYADRFDLGAWVSSFIVNSLMRIVGFVTKTLVLLVGFLSYILVLVSSFFISLIWVLAPLIILSSVILSAAFFVI